MSGSTPLPAETNPTGSLDEAAASFQNLLFPKAGDKRKPGESSTPKQTESEDEVQTTDEVETESDDQPEAEETTDESDEVETDDEVESGSEQPEEDESEETVPTVRSRKVKFQDGTERDVTEDEAYNGFLREDDYTRKSQANAELRKQLEADRQTARESAARHAEELANVKAAMDRLVPKEPNWPELRKTLSAEEYANVVDEWKAFKAQRDHVEAEQKKVFEEQAKDYEKAYNEWRTSELEKLKAAVPEWADIQVGQRDVTDMAKYMSVIGYKPEEIEASVDHRFLLLLRKAMLWDRAKTASKTKVEPKVNASGKIKSAPPGAKNVPAPKKSQRERDAEHLRKTGSLQAAASVFDNLLKGGREKPRR